VNLPATLASAGSSVTVPVNFSESDGVTSASLKLVYDTALLNVESCGVHLGSLTGGGNLTASVDDSIGTIEIWLTLTSPLGPGAGSLVEIDYQVEPTVSVGHESGIGWEDSWRDDVESGDSSAAFGPRRRKGASPPRGGGAPRAVVCEAQKPNRIQWEEKHQDKSI